MTPLHLLVTYPALREGVDTANELLADLRQVSARAAGLRAAPAEDFDPLAVLVTREASRITALALRETLAALRMALAVYAEHHEYAPFITFDRYNGEWDLI